jgi:AcrR family transcriptional regulator
MQAHLPRSASVADTHLRIVEAASRIFARHGLAGSTTRAIAEEAGVNEVTLFRHFQTKDRLLAAVVGQHFGAGSASETDTPLPVTANVRADLLEAARRYTRLLAHNLPLVRTMLGEIHHRHRDQETQVFRGIFAPVKAAIRARLELAQRAGELRGDVRADILADLFGGMIFTGVIRRDAPDIKLDYSASAYLEAAVDLLLRGAAAEGARRE